MDRRWKKKKKKHLAGIDKSGQGSFLSLQFHLYSSQVANTIFYVQTSQVRNSKKERLLAC